MRLCELMQLVVGKVPFDMSGGAADGDYVSLKNYGHIAIVLIKDAGSSGENPVLIIQQAQDVSGTGAKALNFTEYYLKNGTQSGIGQFTKTLQSATNTLTLTGANEQLAVVEFDAADLDLENGFDCVIASLSDAGSTSGAYGTLLYILGEPRYAEEPMPSAIAD